MDEIESFSSIEKTENKNIICIRIRIEGEWDSSKREKQKREKERNTLLQEDVELVVAGDLQSVGRLVLLDERENVLREGRRVRITSKQVECI